MKKRSLAGNLALGFYILALVLVLIAYFSTRWIASDERIKGIQSSLYSIYCSLFFYAVFFYIKI